MRCPPADRVTAPPPAGGGPSSGADALAARSAPPGPNTLPNQPRSWWLSALRSSMPATLSQSGPNFSTASSPSTGSSSRRRSSSRISVKRSPSRSPTDARPNRSMMTTVFQNVSRNRSVPNRPSARAERIPPPPDRLGAGRRPVLPQLVPQPLDVDFQDVGRPLPVRLPQVLAQHPAGDDLAGVP